MTVKQNRPPVRRPVVITDTEYDWRRFARDSARRERVRYIRQGRIVPAFGMRPQLLVKNSDGSWSPAICFGDVHLGPKFNSEGIVRG